MPLLLVVSISCFVAGLSMRIIDPLVPEIARDFKASPHTVALLATAFTLPYAICQPLIGGLGDSFGKVRIINFCLAALTVLLAVAAVAPTLESLFVARMLAGIASGGVFPMAVALVGDRFAFSERQVALSNLLMAALSAQLFGMIAAGLIGSVFGWRAILWLVTIVSVATLFVTMRNLKPRVNAERPSFSVVRLGRSYSELLRNRRALACFLAVFVEGVLINGYFPYVATLLEARGAGGLLEAGLVLAGFGIGGFIYTFQVRRLIVLFRGMMNMIRWGGGLIGISFFAVALGGPWQLEAAAFVLMGLGFYILHGSLQTQMTELVPDSRGIAIAMHAFFFIMGQAIGPVVYSISLDAMGPSVSTIAAGLILSMLGVVAAAVLGSPAEAEASK